jgi:hypothetical protein
LIQRGRLTITVDRSQTIVLDALERKEATRSKEFERGK